MSREPNLNCCPIPCVTQPPPANTGVGEMLAQVNHYRATGMLVHHSIAQQLCRWWLMNRDVRVKTPALTFVETGEVLSDLKASVWEGLRTESQPHLTGCLIALLAYVTACEPIGSEEL